MPLNCSEIPTGWILPAGRLLHPGQFFWNAYQVAEVVDAHIRVIHQILIGEKELHGELVCFAFDSGVHQEGVCVESMGAGIGMQKGVPQLVGADKRPERFVNVSVDVDKRCAVEMGEIAVNPAKMLPEDLIVQGAGDAEGIPCLMFYGQIIDQLFYLCVIHCIILFLVFVLFGSEFLFGCQFGNAERIFE